MYLNNIILKSTASIDVTIIVDNTYFPLNGANFLDTLMLDINFDQNIKPDTTYYIYTTKC